LLTRGLLESAVNAPQAWFGGRFLLTFPFEMAGALMCSLARNHAFIDANKRTAILSTIFFLSANGYASTMTEEDLEELVLGAATGRYSKEWVASRLAGTCVYQPD